MLSQDSLEQATRQAGIEVPPRFLERTDSTNTVAASLAEAGAPQWTVVAAGHQTAGRGRLGRTWASAPGKSLLFSVVLRPMLPVDRAALVSLLAATDMAGAARAGMAAKWPNDLVIADRKVGGILPEAKVSGGRLVHLVLGVGVNVSMAQDEFPPEVRAAATSLAREGGEGDAAALLGRFLVAFTASYRPADPGFADRVLGSYRAVCSTLGRRVRATTTEGLTVEGTAVDVDERGGLLVRVDGRVVAVAFGEVAHLG
ncbi:MAG TPA: biotin--[acetyl-CoA-carboxylase] ligase [Actinomycetota bacterium]|nr:biotin--[acetyl-CoA-carboxylase] ligase [Actinomycetota bacterium]